MPPLNLNERQRVCGTFNLTDHHGRSVSNESFRGRFMLIFFGFTHCRIVCPRALTKISGALDALGEKSRRTICSGFQRLDPVKRNGWAFEKPFSTSKVQCGLRRAFGRTGLASPVDALAVAVARGSGPVVSRIYSAPGIMRLLPDCSRIPNPGWMRRLGLSRRSL